MHDYPDLLAWLDIETTDLDPAEGSILEVGLILTDSHLLELARESWVLSFDKHNLPLVSDWSLKQHLASGLLFECFKSPVSQRNVAERAVMWLGSKTKYISDGQVPMCGASVHFDRAWLKVHLPELERWFYYGNLDVSAIEKVARLWFPERPAWKDRGLHRAIPDNEDAIAELKHYVDIGVLTWPSGWQLNRVGNE